MNKSFFNLFLSALVMSSCSFSGGSGKVVSCIDKSDSITMILGSYCNSDAEGLKVYTFNQTDGGFSYKSGIRGISNPSFISDVMDGDILFSVGEDEGETASACAIKYDDVTKALSLLDAKPTQGGAPCNIAVSPLGNKVFTANYMGGNLSAFDIKDSGMLELDKVFQFEGSGPDKSRQEHPHIHSVNFTPDGTLLWANDLGSDKIRVIDLATFTHDETHDINLPSGCGPRHTCFHNNGRYAYVITELSGDVLVLELKDDNSADLVQSVKADTLGAGGSADIHMSPDGKYLYASCRLKSDGIAVFSVDSVSGMLKKAGYCLTGKHPRNFAITPNGKYMLVACRDENAVEIYSRDADTGLLEDTGKRIEMSKPVCIRWVR